MQKEIIDAFKEAKLDSEENKPKHIETTISNVFIFEQQVYKLYKDDCEFFNNLFFDLSKQDNRFDFTKRDFDWNNFFSPNVYTDFFGVKLKDGEIIFVNHELADELVIIMNKIDTEKGLSVLFYDNSIDESKSEDIGNQLAIQLNRLPDVESDLSFVEAMEVRKKSTIDWISSIPEYIKPKDLEIILNAFKKQYDIYLKEIHKNNAFGPCLDIHLENLVYADGQLLIIDSYMPKKEWVVADMNLNFYRCAVDMLALSGETNFKILKNSFKRVSSFTLNENMEDFYMIYGAMVSVPTLYALGKRDKRKMVLAEKYQEFLNKFAEKLV